MWPSANRPMHQGLTWYLAGSRDWGQFVWNYARECRANLAAKPR